MKRQNLIKDKLTHTAVHLYPHIAHTHTHSHSGICPLTSFETSAERCQMLIIHVCLFFCCSGKCQTPSAHHKVTNCSFKAHLHTVTNRISYLSLLPPLAPCSLSAPAEFQALLLPVFMIGGVRISRTCWEQELNREWQRCSPGWGMDGK